MKFLLILFIVALALAPLTHFLPSKRQRLVARMREYAAVHGLFVEFRDLPSRTPVSGSGGRSQQVIYYGKRLPPSRRERRLRTAWLREDDGWRSLGRRVAAPAAAAGLPASVLAISVDEGSCGAYWQEAGAEADVEQIVAALEAWVRLLQEGA
ncbi:hypothetical protein DWB85_05690 [Seongchinamella sediminis]|uniref:Uncharacterized protein n=1 Tax=Seongchinamella sediminis TaxID=2283635 RepID=A0A3L7E3B3_9GAMM|nr:hypothetical protein [Seongchinamella sediminis]RLQ22933.1 hypothetical protein DWB85_05690 [Seongchinamella sediminis]